MEVSDISLNEFGKVGSRVEDQEGYKGTVRYIGPVASSKNATETWIGIEWDKVGRGKHDGSCVVDNKTFKYFDCAPTSGSFVRPNKVKFGRTLVEALKERYVALDAPEVAPNGIVPDAFVFTAKGTQKTIEFVGEQKIRIRQQLSEVSKITIRNDCIATCGDGLEEIASHFTDLDLQDNLISDWIEIFRIASKIPLLQTLLLHGNKIGDISTTKDPSELFGMISSHEHLRSAFNSLLVLALNFCGISSWNTLRDLSLLLPSVQELYIAGNSLTDLFKPDSSAFVTLRVLDIGACHIASWEVVTDVFGELPALEELVLDANPIPSIQRSEHGKFQKLRRLSLTSTMISSWECINSLNTYPAFSMLRLTQIPLFENLRASEVRPEVLARITNLEMYNSSTISSRERTESEKSYLRKILRDISVEKAKVENASNHEKIEEHYRHLHPRFEELNKKYGDELIPMSATGATAGQTMASEMINITLNNLSFSSNGSLEPIQRRIPASLTVDRLKLMVKQLFGLDPHIQQLSLRTYKGAIPIFMDEDDASVKYFGACDGADIFINEAKKV